MLIKYQLSCWVVHLTYKFTASEFDLQNVCFQHTVSVHPTYSSYRIHFFQLRCVSDIWSSSDQQQLEATEKPHAVRSEVS